MYSKVLVPLDGSQLSECSLEQLKKTAQTGLSQVILLRVVEPMDREEAVSWATAGYGIANIQNRKKTDAQDYIAGVVDKLKKEGVSASGEVVEGRATETIIDYAEKNQVDLIIISSHGRSGITRWALGSVADRVIRHSTIPVLLVTAPGCKIKTG